jgi:4'-phosphopantetheinyl transferase superfamily
MEVDENKADTYLTDLTTEEITKFYSIGHTAKQLEFAASRSLRTSIFGCKQIYYNEFGSPYIEDQGFISLSHTHGLVALAHSKTFNVGLDVESIREKAKLLHPKFIHPSEKAHFDTEKTFDMSLLWSFKETLFKLADRKGVHFSADLIIRKEGDRFFGTIHQYDVLHEYELIYQSFKQYLITCNSSKEKPQQIDSIRADK